MGWNIPADFAMESFFSSTIDEEEALSELRLALKTRIGAIIQSEHKKMCGGADEVGPTEYFYDAYFMIFTAERRLRLLHYYREEHFRGEKADREWTLEDSYPASSLRDAKDLWSDFIVPWKWRAHAFDEHGKRRVFA